MSPSTRFTSSDMNPQERITSSTPCECTQSSMNDRNGRPASGMTGLGVVCVSGRSRVPSPPASTSACTPLPADPLVREACPLELLAVEEVAAVDDERHAHPVLHVVRPVELAELGPLGNEHDRVGPVERLERRLADARPTEHAAGPARGDRVVDAHVCALAL